MRILVATLAVLLALIQYPLWLGKGGWLRVWELDRQLQSQLATNAQQKMRNAALEGEVRDLKEGLVAIEERARYELGMVKPDEIFVQFGEPASPPTAISLPPPVPAAGAPGRPGAPAAAPPRQPPAAPLGPVRAVSQPLPAFSAAPATPEARSR